MKAQKDTAQCSQTSLPTCDHGWTRAVLYVHALDYRYPMLCRLRQQEIGHLEVLWWGREGALGLTAAAGLGGAMQGTDKLLIVAGTAAASP